MLSLMCLTTKKKIYHVKHNHGYLLDTMQSIKSTNLQCAFDKFLKIKLSFIAFIWSSLKQSGYTPDLQERIAFI